MIEMLVSSEFAASYFLRGLVSSSWTLYLVYCSIDLSGAYRISALVVRVLRALMHWCMQNTSGSERRCAYPPFECISRLVTRMRPASSW